MEIEYLQNTLNKQKDCPGLMRAPFHLPVHRFPADEKLNIFLSCSDMAVAYNFPPKRLIASNL